MKLEEATAVLRPRGSWEAVDLGCALARQHWGRLMRGWLTVAVPLWILIGVVFRDHPGWAFFFLWWTTPLLTRQPVFFMSRALFGQPPGARDFWRQGKTNFRGVLAALTVKRFAMQRPFRLPIIMLEGQKGTTFTQRAGVLSAHGGGTAGGLTLVAMIIKLSVFGAMAFILVTVIHTVNPEWLDTLGDSFNFADTEDWDFALPDSLIWTGTAALAAATLVVEPFYGAAGFALYINTRTHLEGWDIEVAFRRMTTRLAPVAAVGCVLLMLWGGGEARAVEDTKRDPRQVVEEILKEPDFEVRQEEVRIPKKKKIEDDIRKWGDGGSSSGSGMGLTGIGYAIIAALVVGVVLLLWMNREALRGSRRSGGREKAAGPRVVMGMDLTPESLPEDIPQAAWREYTAGRPLDALRLLYRGSLAWLVNRGGLPVHESDTEGDCLRHSQEMSDTQRVSFFTTLTAAWVNCAYADLPPGPDPMKRLCDQWPFSLKQAPVRPETGAGAGAAAAWLLLPLAALFLAGCSRENPDDYETQWKDAGYKGAARSNPWLAAERLLNREGTPAETRPVLADMPAWNTTLFLPMDAMSSRGEARTILRWAEYGGHLIVACSEASRFHNDFDGVEEGGMDEDAPLLKELHVSATTPLSGGTGEVKFDEDGTLTLKSYGEAGLNVEYQSDIDVLGGEDRAARLASFDYGMGRVTLLAGATPFRNRHLGEHDHAAIFLKLVALQPTERVIFVSKSEVTFGEMLKRYAWMPLIALGALIVFWLWRHLPRFGRAVPANTSGIRHFGTQLDEAGRFLSERAGPGALLGAARRAVMTAATQRGLHPDAPDFMDHLAARSGLTHAEVSAALLDATDKNLITTAAALQKLQQSIGPTH
jgi:hypothetical protein